MQNELLNLFDDEAKKEQVIPFSGHQVLIVGESNKYNAKTLNRLFESLGAKIANEPSKNVSLLFILDNPNPKQLEKIQALRFNGYVFESLGINDIEAIVEHKYEKYIGIKAPKDSPKKIKLDLEHFEKFRVSMNYKANTPNSVMTNPLIRKEIFISKTVPGSHGVLATIFGLLGAFVSGHEIILLSEKSCEAIKNNTEDADVKYIEDYYNESTDIAFNYGLLPISDFMKYVSDRIKITGDRVLKECYEKYLGSIEEI